MNCKYIFEFLERHIQYCNSVNTINSKLLNVKRIRQPNFPEVISEYIAKIYYTQKYNKSVEFGETGDLIVNPDKQKIEVKAFTSKGPTSFGPTETWNKLMFIDARLFKKKRFKIYIIDLQNDCKKWKNLKMNHKETFEDQCLSKRRPRIKFNKIKEVLKDDVQLIFDGLLTLDNNSLNFKKIEKQ